MRESIPADRCSPCNARTRANVRTIVAPGNPVFAHRITIPENRDHEYDTRSHTRHRGGPRHLQGPFRPLECPESKRVTADPCTHSIRHADWHLGCSILSDLS